MLVGLVGKVKQATVAYIMTQRSARASVPLQLGSSAVTQELHQNRLHNV